MQLSFFLNLWNYPAAPIPPGFRHLLFFVNSKNPVFKPFVAYFFVNFLNFICCTELYFYEKRAII